MNQPRTVQYSGEPAPLVLSLMLATGIFLLCANLAVWLLGWIFVGYPYGKTWQILVYAIFFGRAAAVGLGLEFGFSSWFLFFQTAAADFIIVCLVYPFFVRGYQHFTRVPYIGNTLDNMHKVALSYKPVIAPYGFVGLMLFVIFPFWSTGALVGAILGYIIGLPVGITLISINLGNVVSIGAWVWFYDKVRDWNHDVAIVLLVLILAVAIAGIVVGFKNKKKKRPVTGNGSEPGDAVMDVTNGGEE